VKATPPPGRAGTLRCGASLLCLLLSACGGLLQSNAKPEQTYYLRPPTAAGAATATSATGGDAVAAAAPMPGMSLRVGHPVAGPGLETAHIMLVQGNHRMNFYTGSRWAAAGPELIESLAVETLRASGAWSLVQDSSSPFPTDYMLGITIERFEADYTAGGSAPVVYVVFHCTLGRREGREVIATFSASGEAPAAENRLAMVVAAFETATGTALTALSQQTARAAQADAQKGAKPVPSINR
jgi:ABC-type uncharacterized transport system auxiliary subunit